MIKNIKVNKDEINELFKRLNREARLSGYNLNPNIDFTKDIVNGLLINEKRYGYFACPCRLASGNKSKDLDIICPCDYRDADLNEYGLCYCNLYVSEKLLDRSQEIKPIPERRLLKDKMLKKKEKPIGFISSLSKPIWRCRVCGYLCGRDIPPEICPICKAKKERFEKFIY
jgi:ferredoxin-thioredoxin reductase catalytic subunit